MLKWNATETNKIKLKMECIQLIAMGWYKAQWNGMKLAEIILIEITRFYVLSWNEYSLKEKESQNQVTKWNQHREEDL